MRFYYSNILLQKSTFTLLVFIFSLVWAIFWLENCPHLRVQLNLLGGRRLHRVWSGLGRQHKGGRWHPGSALARLTSALGGQPGAHIHTARQQHGTQLLLQHGLHTAITWLTCMEASHKSSRAWRNDTSRAQQIGFSLCHAAVAPEHLCAYPWGQGHMINLYSFYRSHWPYDPMHQEPNWHTQAFKSQ